MVAKHHDYLLVDGYNVIYDWPELKTMLANIDHARDRLIELMASYGAYKDYEVFVVFDAHSVAGHEECSLPVYRHVAVIFTRQGETADSFIEKAAYRLAKAGRVVYVATSDAAEQQIILGVGAYRIPARELRLDVIHTVRVMQHRILQGGRQTDRNEIEGRVTEQVLEKLKALCRER
jgi:predicted RNA-binding protein with PIN domain